MARLLRVAKQNDLDLPDYHRALVMENGLSQWELANGLGKHSTKQT